jgi:hypothetical protein
MLKCKKCGKCYIQHGIKCVYLTKDNLCSIYNNRIGRITHKIRGNFYACFSVEDNPHLCKNP